MRFLKKNREHGGEPSSVTSVSQEVKTSKVNSWLLGRIVMNESGGAKLVSAMLAGILALGLSGYALANEINGQQKANEAIDDYFAAGDCGNLGSVVVANSIKGSIANPEEIAKRFLPGLFDGDPLAGETAPIDSSQLHMTDEQRAQAEATLNNLYFAATGEVRPEQPPVTDEAEATQMATEAVSLAREELERHKKAEINALFCYPGSNSVTNGLPVLTQLGITKLQTMHISLPCGLHEDRIWVNPANPNAPIDLVPCITDEMFVS